MQQVFLAKKIKMGNSFFKNKNEFKLFDFLFWLILGIIFPAATGNFSWPNIGLIVIYLSAVYYAGELLLGKIDSINSIPFLFKSGLYIIFGGIVAGLVFLFLPYDIILYTLAFIFFSDLLVNKRVAFSFSAGDFLCLIPAFVILFQKYELAYATGARYNHNDGDYYYYTAIVESLKTNQSINNAIYHLGLPINYSIAPFLAPAQLSKFSVIPAQFALWGVFSKILPVVCIGTIAYTVVKLYEILFSMALTKTSFIKKQVLITFLFLLLGPLHFLNLIKLDLKNTLFLGEGYVLPIGSPGFALSMLFASLVFLLVFSKINYGLRYALTIIIFLVVIAASKFALFVPLAVLFGALSLFWLFIKERSLFITLLVASPFCLAVYKLTLSARDASTVTGLTTNGYYLGFFKEVAGKYGISGSTGTKVLIMLAITVMMWLSIKLLVFLLSGLSLLKKNYKAITLMAAGVFSFLISILPGFFISFYGIDSYGQFSLDYSFDMVQFVRGCIFLLTLIGLIFTLYLVTIYPSHIIKNASRILIAVWMLIISYSFFATEYKKVLVTDQSWYKEVREDFFKQKPSLMAMMGTGEFSGQTLTTAGVYPWFCTGKSTDREGFVFTLRGNDRNELFQKIFDTSLLLSIRTSAADSIKKQGVDCIVGSPGSLLKLQLAQKDSIISPVEGTKWLYEFN